MQDISHGKEHGQEFKHGNAKVTTNLTRKDLQTNVIMNVYN